jgi:hypothetical protein
LNYVSKILEELDVIDGSILFFKLNKNHVDSLLFLLHRNLYLKIEHLLALFDKDQVQFVFQIYDLTNKNFDNINSV